MTAIALPPLLIDNERLRELMREHEQNSGNTPAPEAVLVTGIVKPSALSLLAALTALSPSSHNPWPQSQWPGLLRQLHWELCASTQLRPLARIMHRKIILPDPFVEQGGYRETATPLPTIAREQSRTQLLAALRLDVVLAGSSELKLGDQLLQVNPGDGILADAFYPIHYPNNSLRVWTEIYYTPDPCCCGQAISAEL